MSVPEPIDGSMVHALHKRWKPTKNGAALPEDHAAVRIRIHRCLSWLGRIEAVERADEASLDAALVFRWIALNSLYGRWDPQRRAPEEDRRSLEAFLDRILARDTDRVIEALIVADRALVNSILKDEYLSRIYWEDPGEARANRARKSWYEARTWYIEGKHRLILDRVLERVYLARCQLVHGAATHDSRLNRDALRRCSTFLEKFLHASLVVIMDHAWDEGWDDLCYPPS